MKKITPDFYVHLAKHLEESLSGERIDTIHYLALAESGAAWNNAAVEPEASVYDQEYNDKKKIISAKKIGSADVSRMIAGKFFSVGTVYDMYSHLEDMSDKNFFVAVKEISNAYTVWKCLFNNNGRAARVAPIYSSTSAEENYQITADGYMWKFMFRVDQAMANKFSTSDFIPVFEDETVKETAVPGSIDVVRVIESGMDYNSYSFGNFKQIHVAGDPLIYSLSTSTNTNTIQYTIIPQVGMFEIDPNKPVYLGDGVQVAGPSGLTNLWTQAYSFEIQDTDEASFVNLFSPANVILPPITTVYQFDSEEDAYITSTDPTSGATIRVIALENAIASAEITSTAYKYIPTLSANTDFYKNSSIYIRSGLGAGQLRTVAEYIVTGNERRIVLDSPFDVTPDINSSFEILPRIIISGDGTGGDGTGEATAIPVIDTSSNSIVSIQVVDPGKNYTKADIQILANTGYIDIVTGDTITANAAIAVPILPPAGGHGANVYSELFSNSVGVSKTFTGDENERITAGNDFGRIILMKSVQTANTELTIDINSLLFQDGELVTQSDGMAKGIVSNREGTTIRLSNIEGQFSVGETITTNRTVSDITAEIESVDRLNDVLNGLTRLSIEIQNTGFDGNGFRENDEVFQMVGSERNATGRVFTANSSVMTVTFSEGVWNVSDDIAGTTATVVGSNNNAVAKITGKVDSDIQQGSGVIEHIETISPVERNIYQNETVRLVISTKD